MRQAKPREADQLAVLRFMQELEEAVEQGRHGTCVEIGAIVLKHWPKVGPAWQRVYSAGLSAFKTPAIPT